MSVRTRGKRRRICVDRSTADRAFDQLVPTELRHLSRMHWTPIEVAIRVAGLLPVGRGARVLDIGAGIGKVCAVGALSSEGTWCGVEQHELLVLAAERLSRALGVADRTQFVHGDAFSLDWNEFDALYLYNPFELPLFTDAAGVPDHRIQVARVEARLAALPVGTRVVTLNGFGGVMPGTFELLYHERAVIGVDLVCWIQRSGSRRRVAAS